MEVFFQDDQELLLSSSSDSGLFWYDEIPPVTMPGDSSFMPYSAASTVGHRKRASPGLSANMNKRVLDFARRSWPGSLRNRDLDGEKGYRHMMSERMRREKQKRSFSVLHSLLPQGTKNDKNSIIQGAASKIMELQRSKEELQRRNSELKACLCATGMEDNGGAVGGTKIKVRVRNPVSGIGSMLEVLRCLDGLGLKTATVKSKFSPEEFSAVLEIREEIAAAEVEKVIQSKLLEAERKLRPKFP